MRHARRVIASVAVPAMLAVFTNCSGGSDGAGPEALGTPPVLPPLASMEVDVSFFREHAPAGSGSTLHWNSAVEQAALIEEHHATLLDLPTATLRAASAATPVFQNGAWRWPFALTWKTHNYSGNLSSGLAPAANLWEMRFAAAGTPPLDNPMLFSGFSGFHNEGGQWTVPDPENPTSDRPPLVSWSQDHGTFDMTLTRDQSILSYHRNDAYRELRYFTAEVEPRFSMWWNEQTGEGGVSVAESDNHCWDVHQLDRAC